jgi:hypothetical protein
MPDNYFAMLDSVCMCELALRTALSDFAMYVVNNLTRAARHSANARSFTD